MGLQLDPTMIMYFGLGIVILFLCGWFFMAPIKMLIKLAINSVLGAVILVLVNYVGDMFGFNVEISALNCVIVGFLGIPGVILVVALKFILA